MKAVIQRVTRASVTVDGELISSIGSGLMILLGVAQGDTQRDAEVLADKIANLRIFTDSQDKMNLSLLTTGGSALVVSQFTLCANCSHGRRPEFFSIKSAGVNAVLKGVFGAKMKVDLLNDGPVTIIIDSGDLKK